MDKAFSRRQPTSLKIHLRPEAGTKANSVWSLSTVRQAQASLIKLSRPVWWMLTRRSHTKLLRSGSAWANPQIGAKYSSELISNRS